MVPCGIIDLDKSQVINSTLTKCRNEYFSDCWTLNSKIGNCLYIYEQSVNIMIKKGLCLRELPFI